MADPGKATDNLLDVLRFTITDPTLWPILSEIDMALSKPGKATNV